MAINKSFWITDDKKKLNKNFWVKEPVKNLASVQTTQSQASLSADNVQSRIAELNNLMRETDLKIRQQAKYTPEERSEFQRQYGAYNKEYYSLKKELEAMNPVKIERPTISEDIPKTYISNKVQQSAGDKVANFFKTTVPEVAEGVWDNIKEPFAGPSLKQVMTEAKMSPKMLVEDAKIQMGKEDPTREDYALVKQTQEAIRKYGMPDSNVRAITEDTSTLQEQLKRAEKTWQVSPIDAAVANIGAGGAGFLGDVAGFTNMLGADKVPVLKDINNAIISTAEVLQENAQDYNVGTYGNYLGNLTQVITRMVPYFLAGTGKAVTEGSKVAKVVLSTLKNPSFWVSLTTMAGQKYNENMNNGVDRGKSTLNALLYAIPAALVEVQGGIGAQEKEAQSLLKTIIEENFEEISQDIIEGTADKITTKKDMPVYSTSEDAIINPKEMLESVLYTTPATFLTGGVSRAYNNRIANIAENQRVQAQINQDIQNYKNGSDVTKYIPQNIKKNEMLRIQSENVNNFPKNNVQKSSQTQNIQQDNVTLPTQAEMAQRTNMGQIDKNADRIAIDKALTFSGNGGYRNVEQVNKLRESIRKNGIKNPIELFTDSEGKVSIYDGNHRLAIAKELGMTDIPVKYLDANSQNVIENGVADTYNEEVRRRRNANVNGSTMPVSGQDAGIGFNSGNNGSNHILSNTANTITENDRLLGGEQGYNNRSSGDTARRQDITGEKIKDLQESPFLVSESRKGNMLPTEKSQETLRSARLAGMSDVDMNNAIELNNLLQSGASLKFYDPNNIPQGVNVEKAKVANGFYSNGTIWINKNSKNAVETILGHELTHHLEQTNSYTDLANTILDSEAFYEYVAEKGYSNVAEYRQSLGQNYTAEQFDSEMVANFVQDKLFSDQNSINRLARQNTKLVEKIKNWLSDLVVSLRGTAQEKELRKIENMYRKALEQARNSTATSTETQYSYSGKVGLDNLKSRYDKMNAMQKEFVNELENNYQKALYLSSKGYKNNQILKETGWFESDGKWKWEIPDEYFKLKDNANLSNGEHNLSEIIEHDLVFMVYPELAKQKVVVSDKTGKSFYNTIDDKIYLKIGEKTKGAIELNLLHELQHSIQNIEGFDGGTSTFGGMLRYYKKHGEIEASDTVRRFKQGKKYADFDRENVAPELSKENPKHPMFDKYLAGETEKQTPIRDYLYQKSKEKGNGIYEKVDRKAFGMEVDEADNAKDMRVDNGGRNGRYVNDTAGKEPAFSMPENRLEDRLTGDALLDAQDLIDELKSVNAQIDENGYVTVYHRTDSESANKIYETGKMKAKEDGVFFSTSENGINNSGYGSSVISLKVPVEKLVIDDIFADEASVKIPLKNKNEVLDIKEYIYKASEGTDKVSFSLPEIKQKQLEIIQKSNPVNDDYHTWVRDVSDIKTFEEALQDSDYEGWENGDFAPDYTGEMAKQALKSGKVTIYSSYPIEQGVFVTPSKMEAKSYAGSGGFYSKTVDLRDVAWIDPTQGQYAKVTETDKVSFSLPDTDNQGRKLTKEQQEFFKDSKVRDENGNLQVVYHGTNSRKEISTYNPKTRMYDTTSEKFNVFKISTEFDTFGAFFADDYDNAGGYGSTVYEVYLNLTNPLVIDCKGRNYAAIEYNGDVMDTYDWAKWANKKGYDGVIFKNIYDGVGYEYMNKPVTEYVAFKANQVKEVTNTNPTSHPDIRYSMNPVDIAKNPPNPQNGLLEEIAPINEKELENVEEKERVASVLTRSPKRPAKDLLKQSKDVFMRKIVDAGHTIDTVGKLTGDKHLYQYYNNTKQSRQSAEYMIGEAQTDIRGNRVGNSLIRIFESVRAKGDDYTNKFFEYLLHMHNIDRMAQNKPVFGESITAEDSSRYVKELLEKYPEFEKQANKVYAYNKNLMQWRVDSGLISQEQADLMNQMYPHYVPTFRDVSGTSGSRVMQNTVQISNTVRKAKGGNQDIMPIDASMARQTMQTVQAAKRNLLGNRLLNDVLKNKDKVGEYVQAVEKVNEKNDVETEMETPKDTNLDSNNNVFKIFRNGETYVMKVNNGIYEGLKSISSEIDNTDTAFLLKPVKAANNMFKQLITGYSPMFTIRNFARDIQDAGLYSKDLKGFLKKYPKAYGEMIGNGKMWQLYKSLGGTGSSFFDYETGIEKTLDTQNKASTKIKDATVGKIEELNMMIEQAPRFAEFMATVEKAGNTNYDTLMEAMLNAADITVNFGRSGTWGKALNSTFVPFLNPSIQGFDKFTRTILESKDGKQFAKLAVRATLLGILPSVINELLYWDDDEYENLTDRDKDTNFLIKVGENKWLKIPKGRVLSIFGNTANRVLKTIKDEEWDFDEYVKNQVSQTAPISVFDSNLYSPIQAVQNNKTWYGSDIVPQRLQDYAPKDQYDENTDIFSKWLGGKINYSPKKINYLIDAYTGIIGDVVLPLTTPKAETNPFTKAFVLDGVSSNEISNDFYKMMDKYNTKQNPKKSAKEVSRYLNKQSKQVSDIFKQIREIENSEISDAEKRKQVRELRELANTIELTAMATVPEYEKAVDKYRGTFSDEDVDSEYAYLYANRDIFGSEYAVKTFSKALYNNHKNENMDKFFKSYFNKQYFQKKIEPEESKGNSLPTLAEQRAKLPSLNK